MDAEWMAYLGAFPYLRSLNVAECHRINNSALWPLAGMTSLKELDLSRCKKVTDAGIKHLLSISHLEKLHLSRTGVTAGGIKLLSELKNLSTLDLGGLPVTDLVLNSLQVFTVPKQILSFSIVLLFCFALFADACLQIILIMLVVNLWFPALIVCT